jgi:hypothetical protein
MDQSSKRLILHLLGHLEMLLGILEPMVRLSQWRQRP